MEGVLQSPMVALAEVQLNMEVVDTVGKWAGNLVPTMRMVVMAVLVGETTVVEPMVDMAMVDLGFGGLCITTPVVMEVVITVPLVTVVVAVVTLGMVVVKVMEVVVLGMVVVAVAAEDTEVVLGMVVVEVKDMMVVLGMEVVVGEDMVAVAEDTVVAAVDMVAIKDMEMVVVVQVEGSILTRSEVL